MRIDFIFFYLQVRKEYGEVRGGDQGGWKGRLKVVGARVRERAWGWREGRRGEGSFGGEGP